MDLRKYQQLVLDQALDGNRIAVLPTGSGKTLIACHVIEYRIKLVRKQRGDCEWGKVVVYIAPTKVLLNQQIPYIQTHTPCNLQAIALDGDTYYNALKIEFWGEKEWMYYFRRYEVFGMTPEVFRQLLDKRIIPPSTIDAVIIDECHHARGAHPMALMAKAIIRTQDNVFLFSMTASPFNRKKGDKNKMLHELQQNLNSSFIVINMDMKSSIDMHRASPCLWVAKLETNPSCDRSISTLLRHALVFERIYFTPSCHSLPQYKVFFPNPRVFSSVERLQVFEEAVHRIIVTADALGGYGGLCALRLWLDDHMTWSSAGNSCLSARVFSNEDAAVVETIVAELEEEDSTYRNGLCNQQNCIVTAFMKLAAYLVDLNRHELINGQLRTTQGELPSVNQMIITAIDNGGVCPPMLLVTPLNTFFRALCQVITSLCDKLSTEFSLQVDPHRVNNVSLLSPKLRWLFHCLQQYLVNPQGDESIFSSIGAICIQKQLERRTATDHPSNGKPAVVIVFCKMRLVVATLFHLAMLIQKSKSPYVKALMLKGDTSKREQQRIMRELRKGPANVLFATDVVEEGVDLAACNLVIHFDPIDNLKSFIQRKGRARRLSAHCIHIIHDEKSLQDIHGFIEEEENWKLALSTILHAPSNPDQYFEVPATKARIYGSSAVGLVNEYCRMMFLNRHSIHSIYHRHPVPKDDSSNTSELFQCDLRVPMLQVHENGQEPNIVYHSFCSDIHPSKRAAKEQVALQAVERLHQMGVLDDHLRLTSRRQRKHEPVGQNLPRESAESLRSVFKNSVPDLLRLPPDVKPIRTVYLHSLRVIPMHEMQEQPSSGLSHNIAALESICIGLLQPLPSSALAMKSTILLRDGVANVLCEMQWEVLGSLEVTERPHGSDFLPLARRYHEAIACIQLPLNFLPPRDFLPIPLSQDTPVSNQSLDFNWQDWVSSSNNTWYILLPRFPALLSEVHPGAWLSWLRESTLKAEALIHNLFVIHHNSTAEAESFFPNTTLAACNASDDVLITSNGRNLLHYMGEYSEYGLNSTMPRSQKTFYAHYAQRPGHYRRVLDNLASIPDYKLCMAHPVSTKLTWIDILMSSDVAGEKHESKAVEVIPDLCQVLGSMQQFRVMMLFPSVALHLNAVAMAADCQVWLSQQMQGDSGTLPSVELILRAITPKLLQENISSERLEFYGDSVLKYAASVVVFLLHREADQGQLTNYRMKIINNHTLANITEQCGLHRFLRLDAGYRALDRCPIVPPGHQPHRSMRNLNLQKPDKHPASPQKQQECCEEGQAVEIRSKLFADLLEAMLGAIYLTIRDLEGAISFLQSIQLLPPLSLRDHDNFGSKAHHNMGLLSPVEVHQIESILGYTFKDSYLLSMACTHPSYTHIAMASYERLEFLGDAVLDFCVVEVIYPQEDKYPDEGALTDEKCRRTRNTALAAVANRLGLYRFVRHNIIGLGGFRYGEREEEIDSTDSSISEYVEGSLSTEQPSDGDDIDEEDDGSYPIIGEEHKAWADVVEALVGAVFLDSEFSLEVVKKVVAKLGIVKHMN